MKIYSAYRSIYKEEFWFSWLDLWLEPGLLHQTKILMSDEIRCVETVILTVWIQLGPLFDNQLPFSWNTSVDLHIYLVSQLVTLTYLHGRLKFPPIIRDINLPSRRFYLWLPELWLGIRSEVTPRHISDRTHLLQRYRPETLKQPLISTANRSKVETRLDYFDQVSEYKRATIQESRLKARNHKIARAKQFFVFLWRL